jgi:hypothetical protein
MIDAWCMFKTHVWAPGLAIGGAAIVVVYVAMYQ